MKNVYDIRYEKNLIYILSQNHNDTSKLLSNDIYAKTAIIFYLYYIDTLSVYWTYLDELRDNIDIYIISSREEVLEETQKHVHLSDKTHIKYILKENRGRDMSALLVTSEDIIKRYEYICFLHDKKEHRAELKKDTELWIKNLWGNLVSSSDYIDNILRLFIENPMLGILAPPEPIGDYFRAWYGFGWGESFDITRKLMDKLQLNTDINIKKPPITLGTALWFRSQALQKLFAFGWKYSDFNDEELKRQNYLSYGLERIFPYVAQDAGFDTGTVMTVEYARIQTGYLQNSISNLFLEAERFFPITSINDLAGYKMKRARLIHFAEQNKNKRLYLYGAGLYGRFCVSLLREVNLFPDAYLVSSGNKESMVNGLPVFSIYDIGDLADSAVVITVVEETSQNEMIKNLELRRFNNYLVFWD